jgi:hypothetical protein
VSACQRAVQCDTTESLAAVMAHAKAVGSPLTPDHVAMLLEACVSDASPKCLELLLREGGAALLAPARKGKRAGSGGGGGAVDGGALLQSAAKGCCPYIHRQRSAARLSRGARTVSLLLGAGARLTVEQEAALLPVHVMAYAGTAGEAAVSALVAAGADPRHLGDRGVTALHCAAASGHVPLVRLLVGYGVPVGAKDVAGRTALHWASRRDQDAAVRELVRSSGTPADVVDAVDWRGWTALHDAASTCATDAVGALLECGADATALDGAGLTPAGVVRAWLDRRLLRTRSAHAGRGRREEADASNDSDEEEDGDDEEGDEERDEEGDEEDEDEGFNILDVGNVQAEWGPNTCLAAAARRTPVAMVGLLGLLQAAAAWRRRRPAVLCDPYALADLPDDAGSEAVGGKRRRGGGGGDAGGGGKRGRR